MSWESAPPTTGGPSTAEGHSIGPLVKPTLSICFSLKPWALSSITERTRPRIILITKHKLQDITKKIIPKGIHYKTSPILLSSFWSLFSFKFFAIKKHESVAFSFHYTHFESRYKVQHISLHVLLYTTSKTSLRMFLYPIVYFTHFFVLIIIITILIVKPLARYLISFF